MVYTPIFRKKTMPAEGINPEWNYNLKIRYYAKDESRGFDPKELARSAGVLYFSVFDQRDNMLEQEDNIQTRTERKFLGSFQIPLVNLFMNSKLDDVMFLVKKPLALFSYVNLKNPDVLYEIDNIEDI